YKENVVGYIQAKKNPFTDIVRPLINGARTETEKIQRIYNHVRDRFSWNGAYQFATKNKVKKLYEAKTGSSAEINLVLTEMLEAAGFRANPLLISTRGHGQVVDLYPMISQFNHLVCYAVGKEKTYFLDAIYPNQPFDLFPAANLNGKAWLLDENKPHWVNIPTNFSDEENILGQVKMHADGTVDAQFSMDARGYSAFNYRRLINGKSQKNFQSELLNQKLDLTEDAFDIQGSLKPDEKLSVQFSFEDQELASASGDFIYVSPMLFFGEEKNPFLQKDRFYPIDFIHPKTYRYSISYQIPEGFEVDELPESSRMILPNRDLTFEFQCQQIDSSTVQVISNFAIKQPYYSPAQYPNLKTMFDLLIARHGSQIVLKKKR
ncbi:MAG: transglutaminase-like domain-containing protein, partial [Bacteroidota bacterium]